VYWLSIQIHGQYLARTLWALTRAGLKTLKMSEVLNFLSDNISHTTNPHAWKIIPTVKTETGDFLFFKYYQQWRHGSWYCSEYEASVHVKNTVESRKLSFACYNLTFKRLRVMSTGTALQHPIFNDGMYRVSRYLCAGCGTTKRNDMGWLECRPCPNVQIWMMSTNTISLQS